MKLFRICNWAGERTVTHVCEKLGYGFISRTALTDFIDDDIHKVAKTIFDEGLNVMLYHSNSNPDKKQDILFVDTKRFGQR